MMNTNTADTIRAAFADALALSSRVAIYVPTTTDTDTPTDNAAQVAKVAETLSSFFGGATAQNGRGYWLSDTVGLVAEGVTIVYANATPAGLAEHAADIRALAESIKQEMRQEAVSVEIDGALFIV